MSTPGFCVSLAGIVFLVSTAVNCDSPREPNISRRLPDISLVSLPAGTFQMGDTEGLEYCIDQTPVHIVTLSAFAMSAREITNRLYADYLNEALGSGEIVMVGSNVRGARDPRRDYLFLNGGSRFPRNRCWITFRDGVFSADPGKENWPVVFVTWYGAKAFALHYDLDLPTEAEWEYACRGGRQYLFGTIDGTIDSSKANYQFIQGNAIDVGSYPANPFGLYDLSGNVWEWCNDWYGMYPLERVTNPKGVLIGYPKVLRGGAWNHGKNLCTASYRYSFWPDYSDNSIGFRVVRR